jgi:hypothetical protein
MLGMSLFGILFGMIDRQLGYSNQNSAVYSLILGLLMPVSYPESNMTIMWGAVLINMVSLTVMLTTLSLIRIR